MSQFTNAALNLHPLQVAAMVARKDEYENGKEARRKAEKKAAKRAARKAKKKAKR